MNYSEINEKKNPSTVEYIRYDVKKVSSYKYITVIHEPTNQIVLKLTNKPISKLKIAYQVLNSELSKINWKTLKKSQTDEKVKQIILFTIPKLLNDSGAY